MRRHELFPAGIAEACLRRLANYVESRDLDDTVEIQATFCFEHCQRGPTIRVGDQVIEHCTFDLGSRGDPEGIAGQQCRVPTDAVAK